jgi:hypothetical protein
MRTCLIPTATMLTLLGSAAALAQSAPAEPAPVWSAQDPALQWGPCPAFLPEGCALAVLHGDPANDNADVFLKLPPDSRIPSHWHTSPERMVLVSGELHVTYDGHDPAVLRPGSYAYGPGKLPHSGRCAQGDPCVLFIAFESPVDAIPVEEAAE